MLKKKLEDTMKVKDKVRQLLKESKIKKDSKETKRK